LNRSLRLLGHRGAAAERPENTLESFRRAVELGVDVLETDVHMTSDGHIVTSHDPDGRRMTGAGASIAHTPLAQVQSWDAGWGFVDAQGARPFAGRQMRIPRLVDVLEEFPRMRLNIDIKQREPSMVQPLLELLNRCDAWPRVTLASFFHPVIAEVRARGWRGSTVLSQPEVLALLLGPTPLLRALSLDGDTVQLPPRIGRSSARVDLSAAHLIAKCHRLGLRVDYWTINDPTEAQNLLDRGADGLISDDPAALQSLFAARRKVC
jgi:glycerophosphoryl diester phosphodiesterase